MITFHRMDSAPKDKRIMLYYIEPVFIGINCIIGEYNSDNYASKPKPYWGHDLQNLSGLKWCRANSPDYWAEVPGFTIEE